MVPGPIPGGRTARLVPTFCKSRDPDIAAAIIGTQYNLGRLAQRQSIAFTLRGSQVQILHRPLSPTFFDSTIAWLELGL